jgi:hypothetical protein
LREILTLAAIEGPCGRTDNLLQRGNSVVFRHRTDGFRLPNINLTVLIAFSAATAAQGLRNRSLRDRFPARRNTEEKHFKSGPALRAFLF